MENTAACDYCRPIWEVAPDLKICFLSPFFWGKRDLSSKILDITIFSKYLDIF